MAVEGDLVLMKGEKPLTAWETRPDDQDQQASSPGSSSGSSSDCRPGDAAGRGGEGRGTEPRIEDKEQMGGGRGGRGNGAGRRRRGRQEEADAKVEVMRVTAEAARAGVFSIKHVVLPLPGRQMKCAREEKGGELSVGCLCLSVCLRSPVRTRSFLCCWR